MPKTTPTTGAHPEPLGAADAERKRGELADEDLERVSGGVSLLLPAVQAAREAARREALGVSLAALG